MDKTKSANMVGISAGTKNFIEYNFIKNLKHSAYRILEKNNQSNLNFRRELALLIKSKKGNTKSQTILLNYFIKDIKYWSNIYINKYLPNKDEFYFDLINEGYRIIYKRIKEVDLKNLILKETNPKERTKKTWFSNNTNMWIRSYIKAKAEKLKKEFNNKNEYSLELFEDNNSHNLCSITKSDKSDLVRECDKKNPELKVIKNINKNNIKENLNNSIKNLNAKEQNIIHLIYFDESLDGNNSQKIKQISKKLNVSDKRIYFLHASALKKLKKEFSLLKDNKNFLPKEYV